MRTLMDDSNLRANVRSQPRALAMTIEEARRWRARRPGLRCYASFMPPDMLSNTSDRIKQNFVTKETIGAELSISVDV